LFGKRALILSLVDFPGQHQGRVPYIPIWPVRGGAQRSDVAELVQADQQVTE